MGTAREPQPVRLIASLLTSDPELMDKAQALLVQAYGPIDFVSDRYAFDHTPYYAPEFGTGLQRIIVTFAQLVSPAQLPAVKRHTNEIEWALAQGDRRRVNIDPGYVSLGKLVLATTKNHAHRIYLDQGIFGEVTLTYQDGRFRPWPWTYPDYGEEEYCTLFDRIRQRYKQQLRTG